MNFSKDGSIIQANDTSMSLSYWNSDTGVQLTDARHLRDINWSAWTSTCGWPVQVQYVIFYFREIISDLFILLGYS